jgi:pectate lyase
MNRLAHSLGIISVVAVGASCAGGGASSSPGTGGALEDAGVGNATGGAGGQSAAGGAGAGGSARDAGGSQGTGGLPAGGAAGGGRGGSQAGAGGQQGGASGAGGNHTSLGGNGGAAMGAAGGGGAGRGGSGGAAGAAGAGGAAGKGGSPGTAGAGGTAGATSSNGCPDELLGWATVDADGVNGTTGGGDVTPTTVKTFADLKAAVQDTKPRVVIVSGTIKTTDGGGYGLAIASNKTLMGADKNATIYGGIDMSNVSNVIVRNLNINGVFPNSGPDDTVASHTSHHIWYDHLAIWDAGDGLLDITNASDYQTVSWTKFYYTNASNGHRLASLNGSGGGDHPEDSGHLKVTYHHNWWGALVNERMPRVMYGEGHQFNNYFNSTGNLYCIGVGSFGSDLIENNYFKDVKSPHLFMYDLHAYITAKGNVYDNTTGNRDTGLGGTQGPSGVNAAVPDATAFTPPYQYTMDAASAVPAIVMKCAGPQ